MLQINKVKVGKTKENWIDRLVPTEDEQTGPAAPGVAQVIGLNLIAWSMILTTVLIGLPYYMSHRDSILGSLRDKMHYWFPHVFFGAYLFPTARIPLLILAIFFAGRGGGLGVRFVYEKATGKYIPKDHELNDPSAVGDDKYLIPVSRRTRRSDYAGHEAQLDKKYSVLAYGESGSGKSSAIKMLAAQLQYDDQTAVVAHGSRNQDDKAEFAEFYRDLGLEVITVGESRSSTHTWNLFEEVDPDTHPDDVIDRFREIAKTMITEEDTNSPYFPKAAQEIFSGICTMLYKQRENPTHDDLVTIIESTDYDQVKEQLRKNGYNNAADAMEGREGASDEWKNMSLELPRMFAGNFKTGGSFSFREYFENPAGRVVIVDSPDTTNLTGSMYATMLDECFYQMVDVYKRKRTIAILDEIDSIGRMSKVGPAAARGRSNNAPIVVGVQSYGQLRKVYGNDTSAIYSNCQQMIGLRPGEKQDAEKLQEAIGKFRETVTDQSVTLSPGPKGIPMPSRTGSTHEEDRYLFTTGDARQWQQGEGIIVGDDTWWMGRLANPDEWIPKLWRRRGSAPVISEQEQQQQDQDSETHRAGRRREKEVEIEGY